MRIPTFGTCLATFLIARPLAATLPRNEETSPSEASPVESLLEIGTQRHLQALMANMTVKAALARPPFMPLELQAFVDKQLVQPQAFLQAHTSKVSLQLDLATMDADKARTVLNKMALDTMSKLDMQRAECMTQEAKQKQLLGETGQDMSNFNAQGTSARAQVMATQTSIKRLTETMPKLNHELSLHEAKCKESTSTLKKQIMLTQKDAGTLSRLSGMASCSSLLQTGLVRCQKPRRDGVQQGVSFIDFRHHVLRSTASQLKSAAVRQALHIALLEVFQAPRRGLKPSLVQLAAGHRHHRHGRRGHHTRRHERRHHRQRQRHRRHGARHLAHLHRYAKMRAARSAARAHKVGVASWPAAKGSRCALRSNPDCNTLRDKMMLMQADVVDDIDSRRTELASTEEDCSMAKQNLQDQIKSAALRLQEQQAMLAEATTILIEANEQSRLKGAQLDHLQLEHTKMNSFCQESVTQAASELCKIKSIRQELYKMEQKRPFIQDCEVSAWVPAECSKPCGGGMQTLIRQVVIPDDKGASCPPLSMKQSCNTEQCPVNCAMGEWSGWTSCSAKCGGGIKQRIRHVKQRSRHGGKLCGAESESVGCGVGACDKECDLAAWSGWSTCSKACGAGFQERVRRVVAPSTGLGGCAAEDSEHRLQYKRCNTDKCTPKNGPLLKCAAKVDIVLMLDGSGSLGETGWANMKKAGASLVKAFDPNANGGNGAQVAVLLYSGPNDMAAYKRCTGGAAPGSSKVDLAQECKMVWVSHFTTNTDTLATNIGNLLWQKGSTMTSQALGTAEAELVYGRADAQQVVIAVADRLPMMPKRTGQAAASLRKKARLIWAVAAGEADLPKFASWASRPAADNVVYMNGLEEFTKPEVLNKIIADACPKVE